MVTKYSASAIEDLLKKILNQKLTLRLRDAEPEECAMISWDANMFKMQSVVKLLIK